MSSIPSTVVILCIKTILIVTIVWAKQEMRIRNLTKEEGKNKASLTDRLQQADISTSISTLADTTSTTSSPLAGISTSLLTLTDTTTSSPLADIAPSLSTLADKTIISSLQAEISTSFPTLADTTTSTKFSPAGISTSLSTLNDTTTTTTSSLIGISPSIPTLADTTNTTTTPPFAVISPSLSTLADTTTTATTPPFVVISPSLSTLADTTTTATTPPFALISPSLSTLADTTTTATTLPLAVISPSLSTLTDTTTSTKSSLAGISTSLSTLNDTTYTTTSLLIGISPSLSTLADTTYTTATPPFAVISPSLSTLADTTTTATTPPFAVISPSLSTLADTITTATTPPFAVISPSLSTLADTTTTATTLPLAVISPSLLTLTDTTTTATTPPLAVISPSLSTLTDTTTTATTPPLAVISPSLSTLTDTTTTATTPPLAVISPSLSTLTDTTTTATTPPLAVISPSLSTLTDTTTTATTPPLAVISAFLSTLTDTTTATSPRANASISLSTLVDQSSSEAKQRITATTAASFFGPDASVSLLSYAIINTISPLADEATAQTSLSGLTSSKAVPHDAFSNPVLLDWTEITKSPLYDTKTTNIPTFIETSSLAGSENTTLSTPAETTSSDDVQQGTDTTLAGQGTTATFDPTTNILLLTDTLKIFIERQAIFCGVKSLCTIESPSFMQPTETRGCCGYCTCDPNCLKNHDCCVDFAVKTVHGNTTFSSTRELIKDAFKDRTAVFEIGKAIERMYISNVRVDTTRINEPSGLNKDLNNDTIAPGNDDSGNSIGDIECLPRKMVRMREIVGAHYEVVTGCSRRHFNSSSACATQKMINSTGFFGNIPVTSLTTGKTYRNKTVLECCGDGRGSFEYWDMFIECNGAVEFIPIYVQHPLQLQDGRHFDKRCDALFEPNESIRKHCLVPRKCSRVDISTCEHVPPGVQGLFIKRFCEVESQFMTLINSGKSKTYKNVACVLCNSKFYDWDSHCTHATGSGVMQIKVNLGDVARDDARGGSLDDGGLLDVQGLSKLAGYTGDCPEGHIYIQALGECRRVFCQRSMFIVNGSCVPLYDHVTGASFVTIFNMTAISPWAEKIKKSSFEHKLFKFMKTDIFANTSLTTAGVRMHPVGRTSYMVEMTLTPSQAIDVTMNNVVKAVSSLYFTTIDIRVSPNAIIRVGISPGDSWYLEGAKSKATSEAMHSTEAGDVFDVMIRVSKSFACNRIAIAVPLFNVSSQFWVYLPLINKKISFENVDFLLDTNELLVCVDLFMEGTRHFNIDPNSRVNLQNIKQPDDEKIASFFAKETSKYSVLILIIGVAGTLLCVIGRLSAGKVWGTMARCRRESEVNI